MVVLSIAMEWLPAALPSQGPAAPHPPPARFVLLSGASLLAAMLVASAVTSVDVVLGYLGAVQGCLGCIGPVARGHSSSPLPSRGQAFQNPTLPNVSTPMGLAQPPSFCGFQTPASLPLLASNAQSHKESDFPKRSQNPFG